MDRSGIQSMSILSGSNFHQKIIRKYQTGKIKAFRLPTMIFYKKKENFLPRKLIMKLLLQIHIVDKNILSSLNVKTISALREMISGSKTENTLQSILRQNNILNVNNETNIFLKALKIPGSYQLTSRTFPIRHIYTSRILKVPFLKSLFVESETITKGSNKIIKPLILISKTTVHNQVTHTFSSDISVLNPQISDHGNQIQVINIQRPEVRNTFDRVNNSVHSIIIENEGINKCQTLFEHQQPSILPRSNLLFKNITVSLNRLFPENSNWAPTNKPLIKNYSSAWHIESSFPRRKFTYEADGERLHFSNQRSIEKEIEDIKNIILETRKSVLEKSALTLGETDIKRYIDINRISTQVYQDIERRIRMERERRGM